MKNYIIVKSTDFPIGTASASCIRLMLRGLRESGSLAAFISTSNFSQTGANQRRSGHYDGCPYLHMSGASPTTSFFRSVLRSWNGNVKLLIFLFRRRKRVRQDVVLYGSGNILHDWILLFGLTVMRIPWFSWSVELESASWEGRQNLRGKINYFSGRLAEILQPKLARGCVVISMRLGEFYGKRNSNTHVCPILIDPENNMKNDSQNGRFPGKKVVLYSGTFEEKDGLLILMEAFRRAHERIPDLYFVMTGGRVWRGNDAYMKKIQSYLKEHGLENDVEFLGFVPSEELHGLNARADLLLVCRVDNRCANYGFPWKLSEYVMTDIPVLATDVSDISYYFKDGLSIFMAEPGSAESIAEKMVEAFGDYHRALEIAKAGRNIAVEQLSYTEQMRQVDDFVTRILGGKG